MSALGIDTTELVDALLGVIREPARVSVKANGHAKRYGCGGRLVFCEKGFTVTCSEHGVVRQNLVGGGAWLGIVIDHVARRHLKDHHGRIDR
jgi:hypothetical protein